MMPTEHYKCPACGTELTREYRCLQCQQAFREEIKANRKGEFTPLQEDARKALDEKLTALMQEYAPHDHFVEDGLEDLRRHFFSVMWERYHVPAYDIYPTMIEAITRQSHNAKTEDPIKMEARHGQVIEIKVPLVDQVPDGNDLYSGDMDVTLRVINNQIEVEVPDVETCTDGPGYGIPILIEQTEGKLHLAAWDDSQEDPVINRYWPRALKNHRALAEARRGRNQT